jgi:hypothetical protein
VYGAGAEDIRKIVASRNPDPVSLRLMRMVFGSWLLFIGVGLVYMLVIAFSGR